MPNSIDSPCDGCNKAFSYVNLLNLTNDTSKLVVQSNNAFTLGGVSECEMLRSG